MAAQAAERANDDERALISERMHALEQEEHDPSRFLQADVAFHDAILAASGNRLGRAIIATLTVQAYRSLRYVGDPGPDELKRSNVAHKAIHDAVLAGEVELSAQRMSDHILESWHRRRPIPRCSRRSLRATGSQSASSATWVVGDGCDGPASGGTRAGRGAQQAHRLRTLMPSRTDGRLVPSATLW